MAIAYKSQGAGAATETSGAACSPASPATVDAGDILIVHAYFEGTATAPSTPSGFTLLDGPRVIETTIGRHWIYGKIADGSEDGAANALGTAAVTTMRSGRCYSFSGRVAGSITDLVLGFSATSHATDPQMPSVTTTITGGMAVAAVVQNDNNALAAATGMSGGTWAEAVAEFVSALTPGLVLQLQTCIPTADPGTVSGGSVAATNDPSGVIGFEIRPELPDINVTPTQAVLALAATAPVMTFGALDVTPGTAILALAAAAPTVELPSGDINVTPVEAILALGAAAPAITFNALDVTPGTAVLACAAAAPVITFGALNVTPTQAVLVLAATSPVVSFGALNVTPTQATLALAAAAPDVSLGGLNVTPTPAIVALGVTAPSVAFGALNVTPGTAIVALAAAAPTVEISGGPINVTPTVALLVAAAAAPSIMFGALSVTPLHAVLMLSAAAATFSAPGDVVRGAHGGIVTNHSTNGTVSNSVS